MIQFSLFGIPVRVLPFFWLTLALLGGALGADSAEKILLLGLFVIAGFVSILIHELGHALVARRFGARCEITLEAFGGYAAYRGVRMKRWQTFVISAAGPAVQFLFGFALAKSLAWMPEIPGNMLYLLAKLIEISLVWSLLNCLPILPLDGGQMLNALLGESRIRITLWITVLLSSGLAIYVLYLSPHSILPAALLAMFAWQAGKALKELGRPFR